MKVPPTIPTVTSGRSGDFVRLAHRTADGRIIGRGTFNRATAKVLSLGSTGELYRTTTDVYVLHGPSTERRYLLIERDVAMSLAGSYAPGSDEFFAPTEQSQRGRGRPPATGTAITIRLHDDAMNAIDARRGTLTRRQYIERLIITQLEDAVHDTSPASHPGPAEQAAPARGKPSGTQMSPLFAPPAP